MLSKEQMAKVSVAEMLGKYNVPFTISGDYIKVCCNHPAHKDTTPSCNFFRETKTFRCFSCGQTGNFVEYLRRHSDTPYVEIEKQICTYYNLRRKTTNSTPALAEGLRQELITLQPSELMKALRDRQITDQLIATYQIGYDKLTGRLTIPYYDSDYNLLFIKSYLPGDKTGKKFFIEPKWNNCTGKAATQTLYPNEQVKDFDTLVMFGGEMKALAALPILNAEGIGSVSKGGEKIPIHPSQYPELKDKTIIVCMDCDTVGKDAQMTVSQKLARDGLLHNFKICALDLPLSGLPDEKDVNDFLRTHNAIELVELVKAAILNPIDPQPEFANIALQEAITTDCIERQKAGSCYEFESKLAKVQALAGFHYEDLDLVCPSMGYCENCPYNVGQVKDIVKVQTKSLGDSKLIMIEGHSTAIKEEMRMIMPVNCRVAQLKKGKGGQRVFKSMLSSGLRAFIVDRGVELREGVKYKMKAELLADEKSNLCAWVYAVEPLTFSVDDELLKQFQVAGERTAEAVKTKLIEIGEHNIFVTGMGNQLLYHIWLDLALHSSLAITDFDGTNQVGGVSMLTIGDTGTGKSRSYEKILGYLDLPVGEYAVNGTDLTVPGLIGAINVNSLGGPTISAGAVQRRKDRVMIVNECHRLNAGLISKFSDLLSSNVITIDKILNTTYDAGTRFIFFGNPVHTNAVSNWKISSYLNRAEIVARAFKNPEFLRRLTYCYILGEPEVKALHKGVERYSQEAMQHRLWAAWQAKPNLQCDGQLLLRLAGKLNATFSTMTAPYFDGNYTRVKLLQVATAIANATCNPVVADADLEVAYDLLERSFNENMRLGDYAMESNHFDETGAKKTLFKCENREALTALILRHDCSMDIRVFQSYIEPFNFRSIVSSELGAIGAFHSDPQQRGHIVFNPMFIEFLKKVEWESPKYGEKN